MRPMRQGDGGADSGALHPLDRLQHAPEVRQVLDPAQQGEDDEGDHSERADEQDHPALLAVGVCRQGADAHDGEQERPDEGGQRILCCGVFDQEPRGARGDGAGGACVSRDHRCDRKCRHREHAGGEDLQDVVDRLGTDAGADLIGNVGRKPRGQQRQHDSQEREQGRAKPNAADDPPHDPLPTWHQDASSDAQRIQL